MGPMMPAGKRPRLSLWVDADDLMTLLVRASFCAGLIQTDDGRKLYEAAKALAEGRADTTMPMSPFVISEQER